MAVNIDGSFLPALMTGWGCDHEAGEAGVIDHDGVGDLGLDGGDVYVVA